MKKHETLVSEEVFPSKEILEGEIKREKYKMRYKRILKSTIYALLVVAAVAILIATLVLPVVPCFTSTPVFKIALISSSSLSFGKR